jgi:hypothetical protein
LDPVALRIAFNLFLRSLLLDGFFCFFAFAIRSFGGLVDALADLLFQNYWNLGNCYHLNIG